MIGKLVVEDRVYSIKRITKTRIYTDSDSFFSKNGVRVRDSSSPTPITFKTLNNPPVRCETCKKKLDYNRQVRIKNDKVLCNGCFKSNDRFAPCIYLLYTNYREIHTYKIGKTFYPKQRLNSINSDWGLRKEERFKIIEVFNVDSNAFKNQQHLNSFLLCLEKRLHFHYELHRLFCDKGTEYFCNLYITLKDESFIDVCKRHSKEILCQ